MKKIIIPIFFIIMSISFHSAIGQVSTKPTDSVIVNFVYQTNLALLKQINAGRYATAKIKDRRLKAHSDTVIYDNLRINKRLNAVISKHHYQIPAHIDQSVAPDPILTDDPDHDFDHKYVKYMFSEDKKLTDLFEKASVSVTDLDLKKFIGKNSATLKRHLLSIERILPDMKQANDRP